MSDNITLPREVVKFVLQHLEWWSDDEPQEKEAIEALRTHLAAPRLEVTVDPRLTAEEAAAISAALAAEQPKPEPVAWQCREHGDDEWFDCSKEAYGINPSRYVYRRLYTAPPALAAEQPKHPGYIIGSHWLETAYSRVCAGEAEADVLRDIGLVREEAFLTGVAHLKAENEALRRDAERYRWLRDQTTHDGCVIAMKNKHIDDEIGYAENIDRFIDAAMGDKT